MFLAKSTYSRPADLHLINYRIKNFTGTQLPFENFRVRVIISPHINRISLCLKELLYNCGLMCLQFRRNRLKSFPEFIILGLRSKGPGPVQCQIKIAAAVIKLIDLP